MNLTLYIEEKNLTNSERKCDFGLEHITAEGAPIHPDESDGDITDKQYKMQLEAYNKYHKIKGKEV